jgi:CheY-like chemotaxis protein
MGISGALIFPMRFLIADDEPDFARFLSMMIEDAGHEVAKIVTTGGLSVMQAYDDCQPDAVMMDVMMPRLNGVTSARQILSKHPGARIVLMSGMLHTAPLAQTADSTGAVAMLRKPFSQAELEGVLATLGDRAA